MKQLVTILLFSYCFLNADKCLAQSDHLEPANSIFDIYDFQFEYYSQVRNILFDGMSDFSEIRFLVLPSFTPEYVVAIERNKDNQYYLVYHIGKESIWYSNKKDKIKINKIKREIDHESVEVIKQLFIKALRTTKQPTERTQGLDGVNYYFSAAEWGLKTGTVWSPKEGSTMRELVDIGNELILLIKQTDIKEQVKFTAAFIERIEKLKEEIK